MQMVTRAIASPVNIPPGEVEIIVLQVVETVENEAVAESEPKAETSIIS